MSQYQVTAKSIKWTPLQGGGINFLTHLLVKISDKRMEFRPSMVAKFICGGLAGVGLFVPVYHHALEDIITQRSGPLKESLIAIGLGAALIFISYKL